MNETPDFRPVAYLIILAGTALSFAAAVVPFYEAGYKLLTDVLLIGLLPYVVYGTFSEVVRGWTLLVAGALTLGVDAVVKVPERFWHYDGYASGAVYWVPLLLAFVVLPVVLGIGCRLEGRPAGDDEPPASAASQ
jgi:hypothetical protein